MDAGVAIANSNASKSETIRNGFFMTLSFGLLFCGVILQEEVTFVGRDNPTFLPNNHRILVMLYSK